MLLEFRVGNYRSVADEQILSLVASSDRTLRDEATVATGIKTLPAALRSAVFYGANASGKTNLIRALLIMQAIVTDSALLKPDQPLNVQPFRLGKGYEEKPTLFEITVLIDGIRHQYGFQLTAQRITREWLLVYKTARAQTWFEREYDEGTDTYTFEFGSHLTGQKSVWVETTRPNALMLSTAVQLNAEPFKPLYNWFANNLVVFPHGGLISPEYSTKMLETETVASPMVALLRSADLAIEAIRVVKRKGIRNEFKLDMATGITATSAHETDLLQPQFLHRVGSKDAEFELGDESDGTQKLFALSAPLLDILKRGATLVIDELDRSLHPLLVRQIVQTFHDPDLTSGAQLLFSTHDTSLLDSEILRRDQIWLTEKNEQHATTLSPLTTFSPRKGEALERGYLGGRYGAVPVVAKRLKASGRDKKA